MFRSIDKSVARRVKDGLGIGERGLRRKLGVFVCSTGEFSTASRTGSNAGIVIVISAVSALNASKGGIEDVEFVGEHNSPADEEWLLM